MPNWVSHQLRVTGDAADIDRLVAAHFPEGELDFGTVIPMPGALKNTEGDERDTWIENNWWADEPESGGSWRGENGTFAFGFNTAWVPAKPVLERLLELFPTLKFRGGYIEESWDLASAVNREGALEAVECDASSETFRELHVEVYGSEIEDGD